MKRPDIKKMSLKDKIDQTVVVLTSKGKKFDFCPGGAFFFGQIITEAEEAGLNELRGYVKDLTDNCHVPPMITSDFENGCGSMVKSLTPLPYLMGLGATNDPVLAYNYGLATAIEARSIGVNWSFSPVSDLNKNRRNPLVNVRALTDNAELASALLPQVIKGMQDGGIAACSKHFPGDGMDYRDQHITTTVNSCSLNEWESTYGQVFKSVIESDVYSVMAGHISLPAYSEANGGNPELPATLSPELITGLLKGKLGFKGIVVTDALGMGGFTGWYPTREAAEIQAFKAGCDMMLWPTENYRANLEKAILSGEVPLERLDDAVNRILNVKEKLGLFEEGYTQFRLIDAKEKEFVKQVQKECSEKSMTLVRDELKHFPLSPQKTPKLGIIPIVEFEPAKKEAFRIKAYFEDRGFTVDYCENELMNAQQRADFYESNDLIIYLLLSRPFRPMGFLDYTADRAAQLAAAFAPDNAADKTVFVSLGSPYFGGQYLKHAKTYVNGYSMLGCAVEAFVRLACGETDFKGVSPVEL